MLTQFFLILVFFIILSLLQFLSLLPLRTIGLPIQLIAVMATGFLIPTAGLLYYIYSLLPFSFSSKILISLILTFLFEYYAIRFYFKQKTKIFYSPIYKNNNLNYEILFLVCLILTLISFFLYKFPIHILMNIGDVQALTQLIYFLNTYDQILFRLTYSYMSQDPIVGNFYPWAGYAFGATINKIALVSLTYSNILTLIIISFFAYLSSVYFFSKILDIPRNYLLIAFILVANAFPISLILAGNYTLIYGIIGSISLMNFYLLIRPLFTKYHKTMFIIFSSLILIPLHPSAVLTFLILILSVEILFFPSNNFYENLIEDRKFKLILKKLSIIASILMSIGIMFWLFYKLFFAAFLGAFLNSIPTYMTLSEFLENENLFDKLISFSWNNVFTLSYWPIIPVFIFILLIITYSVINFDKPLTYIVPIIIYLILILTSSVSGINHPIKHISFLTIPYYSSPIRITHIGVMIYLLYFARFLLDFQKLTYKKLKESI